MLPVTCAGQQPTVRVTTHSSQNGGWGAGQVVAGGTGHLVPAAISGALAVENGKVLLLACWYVGVHVACAGW